MHLTWLDVDNLDTRDLAMRDLAEAVALREEARQVDTPHERVPTTSSYAAYLRHGWDGDAPQTGLARDENGQAVGLLEVYLPSYDNRHMGYLELTVRPSRRRQGFGRRAFAAGLERIREAGRTLVIAEARDSGPGAQFLEPLGFRKASADVQRRQVLRDVDRTHLNELYAEAEKAADGYELVRIPVPTPEAMMADVVAITEAINDAPTDDLEIEDEVFTPERVRAFEQAQLAQARRMYRLAARHIGSGVLGGHTMVAVEAEQPWYASQFDTSVVRAHRGHRLGLLLKIGMLKWLAAEEPQITVVDTWNAASNSHMIEVNELLGYRVVSTGTTWQKNL